MYTFNRNKLNGKLAEKGMSKEVLAASIGIDRSTFYRRLRSNKLLLKDVHRICDALGLPTDEAISIFLSKDSHFWES